LGRVTGGGGEVAVAGVLVAVVGAVTGGADRVDACVDPPQAVSPTTAKQAMGSRRSFS
jgi:hypothetical protein